MGIVRKAVLAVVVLVAIGAILKQFEGKPTSSEGPAERRADAGPAGNPPAPPDDASLLAEHARDTLKIVRQSSERAGFDSVMKSTLTITNTNPFAVKDVTVICAQFAASGTELPATKATIYEILKSGETRTFNDVNFGFLPPASKSYHCFVADARLASERR